MSHPNRFKFVESPLRRNQIIGANESTVTGFDEVHWFALHVKKNRERFAALNVSALDVEVFLPVFSTDTADQPASAGGRPLFPGYFFARFCPARSLQSVECGRGVIRVIRSGRDPIPVDDAVIREIQERVEPDGLIRIRGRRFNPGDSVSIHEGPFEGMMGRVEAEFDDERRIAILLETLWHARVVIEKRCVEAEIAA